MVIYLDEMEALFYGNPHSKKAVDEMGYITIDLMYM